jgi:hypothetical protein
MLGGPDQRRISRESGIPDFRSSGGIWTITYQEFVASEAAWMEDWRRFVMSESFAQGRAEQRPFRTNPARAKGKVAYGHYAEHRQAASVRRLASGLFH